MPSRHALWFALHVQTSNARTAVKRFCDWSPGAGRASESNTGPSAALTCTRSITCGSRPARSTVACRPATDQPAPDGVAAACQFVRSVSSISRPFTWSADSTVPFGGTLVGEVTGTASPVATAPCADDAQFGASRTVTVRRSPAVNCSRKRVWP